MALRRCGDCKRRISDKASTCPKCGAPGPGPTVVAPKKKSRAGTLFLLAVVLCVVGVVSQAGSDGSGRTGPAAASAEVVNTQPPRSDRAKSITPTTAEQILRRLEQATFSTEIPWRRSRLGDEWLAQSRMHFGNPALPNEAEVQLLASNKTGPYTASVEAEIYTRGRGETDTIQAASNAILVVWPGVPADVTRAFVRARNYSSGGWKVMVEGIQNDGYIIRIEGALPADM